MAIRDVVTMGYGNGTFSPGVSKIPTLGYSISNILLSGEVFSAVKRQRAFSSSARRRALSSEKRQRAFSGESR